MQLTVAVSMKHTFIFAKAKDPTESRAILRSHLQLKSDHTRHTLKILASLKCKKALRQCISIHIYHISLCKTVIATYIIYCLDIVLRKFETCFY